LEYSDYGYVISHLVGILAYNLHIIYMYSAAQSPYVDARRRMSTHVDAQLCVVKAKNFDVRRRAVCEWAFTVSHNSYQTVTYCYYRATHAIC